MFGLILNWVGGKFTISSPCGGVCCVRFVKFVDGSGEGNIVDACWIAFLIVLGMYLYVEWNSFGVSMTFMSGF